MILKAIKYFLKMKAKGVNVISIFRIKGHRIRASDKHLVYHFFIGSLLFVFEAVLLLLNIKQLVRTDWKHFSLLANRITIDEVRAENGCLRLMKNLVWEYDALLHALIAGGTGGGKTYFLLTLIEALLHTNAVLYILGPKNADLADLGTVMGNVYHTKEEMIDCVNAFYEGMVRRSEEMKRHPTYKTGENYAYLGLPPCFLIFDEYVAFFEMLGTKESVGLLSQLKKIVMLGRQAGYFLIVACQRPDAKYFSDGIRDNFNFRVGLGRISELGYGMLFGSDVKKQFFQKRIKGRGYCDVGTSVISEFYTPLVPKGHDFLQTIGSLAQARQYGTATCEAKGDGTD